jgi:site-specific recombinase XerD
VFNQLHPNCAAAGLHGGERLAPHLDSFGATLGELGYADSTVRQRLRLLRDLARWLGRQDLALAHLNEQLADQFLEQRRRGGPLSQGEATAVRRFLEHLRHRGVIPAPEPQVDASPLAALRRRYGDHIEKERGLAAVTVARYWLFIRRFVVERFGDGPIRVRELTPDDIARFLLRHARSGSPGVARLMVTALRSFFRFLFQQGQTGNDLTGAVPTVPAWSLADVPRYLKPEEVERVVRACQRDHPVARRDHVIILLLARLGLRASEVIALELDDIDWRAGVLTVRGKGRSHDCLPLPADVGQALARYLRHHRPPCTSRRVFIRTRAPHRGLANPSSISAIVCRALKRAGLRPHFTGAHLLRHSLATGMLRSGASLDEIGEILRHRAANTTAIYAKVDVQGLRSLALSWPTKGGQP